MTHHYVELHLHTAYSFLEGASQIEELLNRAAQLEYQALAITDHDNLAGAMAFAQHAKLVEIQPITGAELTLDIAGRRCHLTLLAENPVGYANLCRLLTDAWDPERSEQWSVGSGQGTVGNEK
jgi:error-prone DNA polymerase